MKDISQSTALVYDNGLFLPIARRLARDFKRVIYFTPWERGFSNLNEAIPGDGYQDIERCRDIWEVKNDVDVWVFPDIAHSGLQKELISQGELVWGCRGADELELNRHLFLKVLKSIGLPVPEFTNVVGLPALRDYLKDKEDQYIKISRYRGSFETCHFRSWDLDAGLIDQWGAQFGPAGNLLPFLVFPSIETDLEIGADLMFMAGDWATPMLHGIEWKDKSYFASVTDRPDMPEPIREVLDKFGPVLSSYGYTGQFSMEVRVKDDIGYFTDPTCRGGMPSTASQTMMKNFSEVVWSGAHGERVEPDYGFKYSAECVLTTNEDCDAWRTVKVPTEIEDHLKLTGCCLIDGITCFPPNPNMGQIVGWLVTTGDEQKQVIDEMNELADQLPDGLDANTESLAYVLKEIHQAADEGIQFSRETTPSPAVVVE